MNFTETFCGHTCYIKMDTPLCESDGLTEQVETAVNWFAKIAGQEELNVKSISAYSNTKRLGVKNVVAGIEPDLNDLRGLDDPEITMLFLAAYPEELNGLEMGLSIHFVDMKPELIINQEKYGRYNKKKAKELFATL